MEWNSVRRSRRLALPLWSALCAAAAVGAQPAQRPKGLPFLDSEVAMAVGATDYLRRSGDQSPVRAYPARAAYFRTRGEIANSDKWAQRCIDDPAVQAEPDSLSLYQCLGILAGNHLWHGEIGAWAETMVKVRRLGSGTPYLAGSALYQQSALGQLPFESFTGRPTAQVVARPEGVVEVPVRYEKGWPIMVATLSGGTGPGRNVKVEFLVDTGATQSFIAPAFARQLKLQSTPGFRQEEQGGTVVTTALVEPVDLEIGGVRIKDVSLAQTDAIPFAIIGLDVLRQLGPLLLSDDVLRVLGPAWKYTGCQSPLRVTSDPWGRYWNVRSPMKIDGVDKLVMADTGMTGLLEVRDTREPQPADARWNDHAITTMMGRVDRRVRTQTVQVAGAGLAGRLQATIVQPPERMLAAENWMIGGEMLKTHNLLLNADRAQMCWQRREGAGS